MSTYNRQNRELREQGGRPLTPTAADLRRDALASADESLEGEYKYRRRPVIPRGLPQYPPYLKFRGSTFWYETVRQYALSHTALAVLEEICTQLDMLDRFRAALASQTTLWFELGDPDDDGQMQVVVNGLIGESKAISGSISKLMRDIGILDKAASKEETTSPMAQFQAMLNEGL